MGTRKVEISDDVFETAQRTAAIDNIDVNTFLEGLVRRHAEYVGILEDVASGSLRFSLNDYEMQRDPDENDEAYQRRLRLFQ
jgi:predicted PhzF superfamily epimerase YddE/YHI9